MASFMVVPIHRPPCRIAGAFFLFALCAAPRAPLAQVADSFPAHPFSGVTCRVETRAQPPMRWFVAEVDLTNPKVRLRVAPGGPDPDGPGKWQTTLMEPTRIAAREGFDLVVNGDFFEARGVRDAEGGKSVYRTGLWAAVVGTAVTDGMVWSVGTNATPCLAVHQDRRVTIESLKLPAPDDWEVVAGNTLLVKNGRPVPHAAKTRHPLHGRRARCHGTQVVPRGGGRTQTENRRGDEL